MPRLGQELTPPPPAPAPPPPVTEAPQRRRCTPRLRRRARGSRRHRTPRRRRCQRNQIAPHGKRAAPPRPTPAPVTGARRAGRRGMAASPPPGWTGGTPPRGGVVRRRRPGGPAGHRRLGGMARPRLRGGMVRHRRRVGAAQRSGYPTPTPTRPVLNAPWTQPPHPPYYPPRPPISHPTDQYGGPADLRVAPASRPGSAAAAAAERLRLERRAPARRTPAELGRPAAFGWLERAAACRWLEPTPGKGRRSTSPTGRTITHRSPTTTSPSFRSSTPIRGFWLLVLRCLGPAVLGALLIGGARRGCPRQHICARMTATQSWVPQLQNFGPEIAPEAFPRFRSAGTLA